MSRMVVRHLLFVIFVWAVGVLVPTIAQARVETVKCSDAASADLAEAVSFVTDRLNRTVNLFDGLSPRQKNEFIVKWPKMKLVCRDEGVRCRRSADAKRHEVGSLSNRVRLCYADTITLFEGDKKPPARLCDLVEVVVHEFGHANGIVVRWGHKRLPESARQEDPIYRLGIAARGFCEAEALAGQFDNEVLQGKARTKLGGVCMRDKQCGSGKCEGKVCVCQSDAACVAGKSCRKPLIGKNYCE